MSPHDPPAAQSRRLRAGIALLVVVGLALAGWLVIGGPSSRRETPTTPALAGLGVYVGSGDVGAFQSFSRTLGARPHYVMDFLDGSTWSSLEDPDWLLGQWRRSGAKLVLSVPMLPDRGEATLAREGDGDYDAVFRTLARRLVNGGAGDTIIRLGWEFNGDWYRWTIAHGRAQDYARAWRSVVTAMRSVPGAHFRFDWCVNGGSSVVDGTPLDPVAAYPGDSYVDIVGLDRYDATSTRVSDEHRRWSSYVEEPYGLEWQRRFAQAHDKPVSFPEWGLLSGGDPDQGIGGGDSPAFVEDMFAWFASSDLAYESYFDFGGSLGSSTLSDFPQAAQRYRELARGATPVASSITQ